MVAPNTRRAVRTRRDPNLADPIYVSSAVTKKFSNFCTPVKVQELLDENTFRADGDDKYLDIVPCASDEPCCFGSADSKGKNHTYFFETIFADLGYKLPLPDFACSALTLMNIAPTQLAANGWAYLRAFELLCTCLGIEPTCNKFFYFFETAGIKVRGEHICLSSARGSSLFSLFRSNYKHRKGKFFKVKETERCKDIFYFDDNSPRFPFYWTNKPEKVYKLPDSALTTAEKLDVDFLSSIHLNLSEFYDAYSERKLSAFVAEMARLSEADLLRFRREQEALKKTPSPAKSLTEPEASLSETDTIRPQKRKRKAKTTETPADKIQVQSSLTQFMIKTQSAGGEQYGSSSAPPPSWKNTLKEFEELTSEEVTSLWDSKVNFNSLVETNLVFGADQEKIRKIGLQEACQAIMTKGLEISAISKMIELESNGVDGISAAKKLEGKEKENANLKATVQLLEKSNKASEKKAADLALELQNLKKALEDNESLKTALEESKTQVKVKEEEIAKMKMEAQNFASENEKLKKSTTTLAAETTHLKSSILAQFESGFEKAKEQIKFLNPNLPINFEGSDPYASIVDGKLVVPDFAQEEDDEGEEEEEDRNEDDNNNNNKEGEGESH